MHLFYGDLYEEVYMKQPFAFLKKRWWTNPKSLDVPHHRLIDEACENFPKQSKKRYSNTLTRLMFNYIKMDPQEANVQSHQNELNFMD